MHVEMREARIRCERLFQRRGDFHTGAKVSHGRIIGEGQKKKQILDSGGSISALLLKGVKTKAIDFIAEFSKKN